MMKQIKTNRAANKESEKSINSLIKAVAKEFDCGCGTEPAGSFEV